jgi:hypothetical protein
MTVIQNLPMTFDILEVLPAGSSDIVTILYNDPTIASTRFGITEGYFSNGFLTELYVYAEIDSLPEIPLPDYQSEDTEAERVVKSLNAVWGSEVPKFYLQLYRWKESTSTWLRRGKISLTNQYGYPYGLSRPLDLLTDNIARDLGEKCKIGVSIVAADNGLLKSNDFVVIDGCWKQDVRIVKPDTPVISVVGSTVVNVTQYSKINSGTMGTTRRIAFDANTNRISATVKNDSATATIYIAERDITPSSTNNDGSIPPNGSRIVTSTYKGTVYMAASAAATPWTTTEVYNQ